MKTINTITLLGNIGKVEIVEFKDESIITKISLATNNLVNNVEQTQWHTLVFKGRCAHVVSLLQKGDQLMVNGMMTYRSWKDNHGQSRIAPEVIITDSVGEFSIITGQIGQVPEYLKSNYQAQPRQQAPQQRTQAQPRQQAPQQRTQAQPQQRQTVSAPRQAPQQQYQNEQQDFHHSHNDDAFFNDQGLVEPQYYNEQPQQRQAPQQNVNYNSSYAGKATTISYNYR
ncbi:single-stranded DNA-binding protein [Acinetobacter sp. P1(2025)]|uniref:single-stranded DNA-binding protein n=1 Tax=Acinetobacter sp. P1(2025) TaxID=3446120 RepID=UPI003F52C427